MTESLTAQVDNYALYLPALSQQFCEYVITRRDKDAPNKVRPIDLNFLNKNSRLWSYKWCLASAGHLAYTANSNAITRRNPKTSFVMGDSGGYQVGTGALPDIKGWAKHAKDPTTISTLWRSSRVKEDILRWLDSHCDYAMTLDMPLWVKLGKFKASPFHHCSVTELTDLTVENLRYIEKRRGVVGQCKFLNVLQGNDETEEDYWYQKVKDFQFEGWAFGTKVTWTSGIQRILKRILLLRDEGMLGGQRQWLHILGVSQLIWAVALTAIQRGIQASTRSPFTISFDASTPLLMAGKYQRYPEPPKLTDDITTWTFPAKPFPVGYAAATKDAEKRIPAGSPLSKLLTLGDMNPDKSPYSAHTFNAFSTQALSNHNTYVYLRGFIDANEAVFNGGKIPQSIADMVGLISDLFRSEQWKGLLDREGSKLEAAKSKIPDQVDDDEEVAY